MIQPVDHPKCLTGRKSDMKVQWLITPGIVNRVDVKAGDIQDLPEDDALKRYLALGYVKLASDKSERKPYEPADNLGAVLRDHAAKVTASAAAAAEAPW